MKIYALFKNSPVSDGFCKILYAKEVNFVLDYASFRVSTLMGRNLSHNINVLYFNRRIVT